MIMQTDKSYIDMLLTELFPICRSISGNGNRRTFDILSELIPLNKYEIKSGTRVFDWTVPKEWNIQDAWIKDSSGKKLVDFKNNNLHIVNYSMPYQGIVDYDELLTHLHTLPSNPDAIPYRTTYYKETWGFCLSHNELLEKFKPNEKYEVNIESSFNSAGSMTYADCRKKGSKKKEYLISTYCCHPSLANDNLSGLILSCLLFREILSFNTYYTFRLIIVPETIGCIAYLFNNQSNMHNVVGGYVITTVAGPGEFGYKSSFLGNHEIDIAANIALKDQNYIKYPFIPDGSDERQYSSPGFRIPMGTITKDKYYEYNEYHTSQDNLNFISSDNLLETLKIYKKAIQLLEMNRIYKRTEPHCEFFLSKHGLYPTVGGKQQQPSHLGANSHNSFCYDITTKISSGDEIDAFSWLMHLLDGDESIFDIHIKSKIDVEILYNCAEKLKTANLVTEV